MKHLIVLMLFFVLGISAKADTIDYWTVRFRGKVVLSCHQHTGTAVLRLKQSELREEDSLEVFHFNDTPCPESAPRLTLGITVPPRTIATARGDFSPLVFSAKSLTDLASVSGKREFAVYRDETNVDCGAGYPPAYLFTILLE